ncbi:hypothetical protein OG2516_18465 [Oceanicola granulosus HTCC2516]|uniref:Uncharacterized protein n=1 Tax=Oceanicola granulosus (strain ATCC BAA-861 / DSM 15982 / KCTC 12143 / HTCC2516) TaxID=314256 RepID=Q2CHG3_OCEGH|nr:hypothetical protein [Oceanicola granulosus]EAR52076.1 hypothetical protein OG2516_18465 [Oceanicola granulosus HTCC2516]
MLSSSGSATLRASTVSSVSTARAPASSPRSWACTVAVAPVSEVTSTRLTVSATAAPMVVPPPPAALPSASAQPSALARAASATAPVDDTVTPSATEAVMSLSTRLSATAAAAEIPPPPPSPVEASGDWVCVEPPLPRSPAWLLAWSCWRWFSALTPPSASASPSSAPADPAVAPARVSIAPLASIATDCAVTSRVRSALTDSSEMVSANDAPMLVLPPSALPSASATVRPVWLAVPLSAFIASAPVPVPTPTDVSPVLTLIAATGVAAVPAPLAEAAALVSAAWSVVAASVTSPALSSVTPVPKPAKVSWSRIASAKDAPMPRLSPVAASPGAALVSARLVEVAARDRSPPLRSTPPPSDTSARTSVSTVWIASAPATPVELASPAPEVASAVKVSPAAIVAARLVPPPAMIVPPDISARTDGSTTATVTPTPTPVAPLPVLEPSALALTLSVEPAVRFTAPSVASVPVVAIRATVSGR